MKEKRKQGIRRKETRSIDVLHFSLIPREGKYCMGMGAKLGEKIKD